MTTLFHPKESLLTLAGAQCNPLFLASELLGSNNSLSTVGIGAGISGGKEARCRVTLNKTGYAGPFNSGGSAYQRKDADSSAMFYYNKIDLAAIASAAGSMFKLHFIGYKPATVSAIVNEFKNTFGIAITTLDVQNTAITWSGNNASVVLQATANSLAFKGSATISLVHVDASEVQGAQLAGTLGTNPYSLSTTGDGLCIGDRYYYNSGSAWLNLANGTSGTTTGHPSNSSIPAYTTMCWTQYDGYIYRVSNTGRLIRLNLDDLSVVELATCTAYSSIGFNISGTSIIATNGKIVIYGGGYNNGTSQYLGIVQIYDIETNTWSAGASGLQCTGHSATKYNGKMYIIGGRFSGSVNDFYPSLRSYDVASNTWTTHLANYVTGTLFGFINHRNRLYSLFGQSQIGTTYSGVSVYNPITNAVAEVYNFTTGNIRSNAGYGSIGDTLNIVGGIRPDTGITQSLILTLR